MANGNGLAAKFWIPMIIMLIVTSGSLIFGVIQATENNATEELKAQVRANSEAIVEHTVNQRIIQSQLAGIQADQAELSRKLTAAIQGINRLSDNIRDHMND